VQRRRGRAASAGGDYDLVLMDIQMPVMDGVSARDKLLRGAATAAHRGADGQRDACRHRDLPQIGCDDVLAKPIDRSRLYAVLAQRLPAAGAAAMDPALDDRLQAEVSAPRGCVPHDMPDTLQRLEQAMHARHAAELRQLAHRIKGLAGSLGLPAADGAGRAGGDGTSSPGDCRPRAAAQRRAGGRAAAAAARTGDADMSQRSESDAALDALIADAAASARPEGEDSGEGAGAAAPAVQPAHDCDVLIADDTGASRELLAAILRNFGGSARDPRGPQRPGGAAAVAPLASAHHAAGHRHAGPGRPGRAAAPAAGRPRVLRGHRLRRQLGRQRQAGTGRWAPPGFVIKPYKPQRIVDLLERYRERSGHDLQHVLAEPQRRAARALRHHGQRDLLVVVVEDLEAVVAPVAQRVQAPHQVGQRLAVHAFARGRRGSAARW
jgi:CheY-like chemotaxis protein